MNGHPDGQSDSRRDRSGVILLITLVILVILSTLGYTLSARVAARRHRDQYLIDYCIAQNACASGVKYALASMDQATFSLISRPNEPDFSDVFALSEPEYQKLLAQMERYLTQKRETDPNAVKKSSAKKTTRDANDAHDTNDADPNTRYASSG
ncbi:MAG: hypothetical protein ACM3VT_17035, partial [Solirubrobacterales bacterium]